jgi:hypothetical protein
LATSIVPNNFFGSSISLIITFETLVLLCLRSLILKGFNEKKATSEPDISAEAAISINNTIKPIVVPVVSGKNSI